MGIIYKLTSPTKLSYIGQSKHTLDKRWKGHVDEALRNRGPGCRRLYEAMREHGPDTFTTELVYECPDEDMNLWETFFISSFDTLWPKGYNLTKGGTYNLEVSEDTRKRIGDAHRGKPKPSRRKNEDDKGLEKYVRRYRDAKGREGYRVSLDPKGNDSKTFTQVDMSMEEKLQAAREYLRKFKAGEVRHEKKILPVGIQAYMGGYRVRLLHNGVLLPVKTFQKGKLTTEEKLAAAKKYLETLKREHNIIEDAVPEAPQVNEVVQN